MTNTHTCYSISSSMVTKAVKSKKRNMQLKIQNVKCEKAMDFCFLIILALVLSCVYKQMMQYWFAESLYIWIGLGTVSRLCGKEFGSL